MEKKFQNGDTVEFTCTPQVQVLGYLSVRMVEVRLWNGPHLIGDACFDETELKKVEAS